MFKWILDNYKKMFFGVAVIFCNTVHADTSVEVFQRHLHPIFVETGTYTGHGILQALQAGFQEVYSIELSPNYYEACRYRFANYPNVHLYQGDSAVKLKEVLSNINQPVTLWLDAHFSAGDTAMGRTHTPILDELESIASHPIKTHTILIDDIRQLGGVALDFIELEEIIHAIKKINPNYQISFEPGIVPNDVLVAEIR